MMRYLLIPLLLSGCMLSDKEFEKSSENVQINTKDPKKNDEENEKKISPTDPSAFKEFSYERSAEDIGLPYLNWKIEGDTLKGALSGNLLIGFPDVVGDLDSIGDWNIGIKDPCINMINYDIVGVDPRGPIKTDNETTSYRISPTGLGEASVLIQAEYAGWERPSFAKYTEIKEGCENPTYPSKLEIILSFKIEKPDGASLELPELCSDTPTFSEQTTLPFGSLPTLSNDKIDALNWTTFPSFTVQHSGMDLGEENVSVTHNVFLSGMAPGELKITTEFGDEEIIRVAPFSETESYQLTPYQGSKSQQEVDLTKPVRPWGMYFAFREAHFKTQHCTIQTPTILESQTPETCITTDDPWRLQLNNGGYLAQTGIDFITQEGECIIEASTLDEVVQRIAFEIGRPE